MGRRRWSDLAPDVLRDISGRLYHPAEFVYFHAVCKPWRSSHEPLSPTVTTAQFLPWLLAPADKESTNLGFRCVFSKESYRAAPASPVPWRNWVCRADGTAFSHVTVENRRPSLRNLITGEVTHLPLFRQNIDLWEKNNPRGVVYDDGSTFMYITFRVAGWDPGIVGFKAALLNPGGAEWIVVDRTLRAVWRGEWYAAYHGGKIMVTAGNSLWHVITPTNGHVTAGDVMVPKPWSPLWNSRQYSYLLESRGELIWALVVVEICTNYHGLRRIEVPEFSLSLHALEVEDSAPKKTMRWVRKDGHILADRVVFLGWPNSLVMDASRLGCEDGACAYFAYSGSEDLPRAHVGVYRFDLVSNKAELIERLPREWNNGRCTWLVPQPVITPIHELTQRRLVAREWKKQRQQLPNPITSPRCIIDIQRHNEPSFRAMVRNLPLTVMSSQLRLFFSKHGKVSSADVIYYSKIKRSQGIGLLTMSTIHSRVDDALEALNELYLDGCRIEVSMVKEGRQRQRMPSIKGA